MEYKEDHEGAKSIYEEVLAKKPDYSAAANNLAFYYAEHKPTEKNLDKAEKLIEPFLSKYKNSVNLLDTAAWIYYRKGNFKKAFDLLFGLGDKIKDAPVINYHLGMICFKSGEMKKAKKYLQVSLKRKEKV